MQKPQKKSPAQSSTKSSAEDTKARLKRAQAQLGRSHTALSSAKTSTESKSKTTVSKKAEKLRRALGGEIVSSSSGEYLCLKQHYDHDYIHGSIKFKSLQKTTYLLSHFSAAGEDIEVRPNDFLFFDTETTGLSGAGAVPFLIGFGFFVSGGFETRQYIIPDFADEAAMLEDIFAEFSEKRILVSYNGKSFDKPLIEDRLIIHRIAREIPFRHHIDLLHPSRSLFKRRLGDCSLGNIERHALGYERGDDIPGYLVPSVYLDWIHTDETSQLADVISHNRKDIVSLAALVAVISESFTSASSTLQSPLDAYSLMRICEKRKAGGLRDLAVKIGKERDDEFTKLGDSEIEFQRAMVFKRAGDFDKAVGIWRRLESSDCFQPKNRRPSQAARLELAKWYEHRCKDYQNALALTESGLRFNLNHALTPKTKTDNWDKRRLRLKKRIAAKIISKSALTSSKK